MSAAEETAWIRERDKCRMGPLFECFCSLVRRNVEAMNGLCEERSWPKFSPDTENASFSVLLYARGTERSCHFIYDAKCDVIHVKMKTPDRTYTIKTRWDIDLHCRIVVTREGEESAEETLFPHADLWKVPPHILEPFFFFNVR